MRKGKVGQREAEEKCSVCWFTPHMVSTAKAEQTEIKASHSNLVSQMDGKNAAD